MAVAPAAVAVANMAAQEEALEAVEAMSVGPVVLAAPAAPVVVATGAARWVGSAEVMERVAAGAAATVRLCRHRRDHC